MAFKRILYILLALVLCAVSVIGVFAEPEFTEEETEEKELTSMPADTAPSEIVWAEFGTDDGGWQSNDASLPIQITEDEEMGKVAALEANKYVLSGWRGFFQNFSPDLDIFYYRDISISFFLEPTNDEDAKYFARAILRGHGEKEVEYRTEVKAGRWSDVSFDISELDFRHEITNIEISFLAESDVEGEVIPMIYADRISLGNHMYETMIDRYMGERFISYGTDFDFADDGHFALEVRSSSPTLEYDIFVREPEKKNTFLFTLDVGEECKKITLFYASDDEEFSGARSVSVDAAPGKKIYRFVTPTDAPTKRIKLVFEGARSGRIEVYRAAMLSSYIDLTETFGKISKCEISSNKKNITIKGTVGYDTTLKYSKNKLELYALEAYESEADILSKKPLSTLDMTSSFEFRLPINDTPAPTQKYVVCITDKSNSTIILIDTAKHITNYDIFAPASSAASPMVSIKGLQSDIAESVRNIGAAMTVIDIHLDRLATEKTTGYLHTMGNAYYYYDIDYVSELDETIRQHYATGTAVYLRLLISDSDGSLIALRTSSKETSVRADAAIDFLTSRYNNPDIGCISGLILGKSVDKANEFNKFGKLSLDEYALEYARTLRSVHNRVKLNNSSACVIVPLSDSFEAESYTHTEIFGGAYDKKLFISSLCSILSKEGELDWSIMWESDEFFTEERSDVICASNFYLLDEFLAECKNTYTETPDGVFFFFDAPDEIDDDTFGAIYAYSYYTVLFENSADAFILKEDNAARLNANASLLKYIDTSRGTEYTIPLLSYFDSHAWEAIVAGFSEDRLKLVDLISESLSFTASEKLIGSVPIWDFSAAHSLLGWQKSYGCTEALYSRDGDEKFLSADFDAAKNGSIIYTYSSDEKFEFFDSLEFDLKIVDGNRENADLTIVMGGDGFVVQSSASVGTMSKASLFFELSALPKDAAVKYIEIRVEDPSDEAKLYLYKVAGHSNKLDSASLKDLFEAPHIDESPKFNSMWIIIIATLAISSVAAIFLIAKNEKEQ